MKMNIKKNIITKLILVAVAVTMCLSPLNAFAQEENNQETVETEQNTVVESVLITKAPETMIEGVAVNEDDVQIKVNEKNGDESKSFSLSATSDLVDVSQSSIKSGSNYLKVSYKGVTDTKKINYIPKKPSIISLKRTAFDTARIMISKNTTGTRYQYAYSASYSRGYKLIKTSTSATLYKELLKPGKRYYFKVRTYKLVSGKPYYSAWSNVRYATMPKRSGVERWRYYVKKELKRQNVYTKSRENAILKIIRRESGGYETVRGPGGYVGLAQFGGHWKHNYSRSYFVKNDLGTYQRDNRKSGRWSIHTMVKTIKKSGNAGLGRHWNTWP